MLIIVGALVLVAIAGPVVAAVGELVRALLILTGALAVLAAVAGFIVAAAPPALAVPPWRPGILAQQRPAQALPQQPRPAIGQRDIHLHFHGVSPKD